MPERVYKAQPEDEGVKWWEVRCSKFVHAALLLLSEFFGVCTAKNTAANPSDCIAIAFMQVNELIKVDLSHNELQQLPEQFWSGVTAVQTLHLRWVDSYNSPVYFIIANVLLL